ncbi:MAG: hypothetical protein GXP42_07430 [Chloroflexi bacterium]|nr:hypothetical protein [Chloroflexota bacterium]
MTQEASASHTAHDRLFKEFLHRFLPDFLEVFFPDIAAHLDLGSYKPIGNELIANLPHAKMRIADFVAEVETLDGEEEIILVHIEVEARQLVTLPYRMFEYFTLLRALRGKRVLPLALTLIPNSGGLTWKTYDEDLFGQPLIRFLYGQVGLPDLPASEYFDADHPAIAALTALMDAGDMHPAEVKLEGYRSVWDSDLTEGDKLFLINLISTYLPMETIPEPGGEVMVVLRDIEMTWLERVRLEMEEEIKDKVKEEMEKEMRKAKEEMEEEMRKAQDEIREEIEKETKLEMARGLLGILDEPLISQLTGLPLEDILAMKRDQEKMERGNGDSAKNLP